ncbi:hypothetical protein ACF07S_26565 [Streptomyces sp. NPDC016640]|uniref:hypothetical protein n=1 Tax=Streptomyces sp. NPDC016640 TaxID=3364969 RepID=UPI0036FAA1DA
MSDSPPGAGGLGGGETAVVITAITAVTVLAVLERPVPAVAQGADADEEKAEQMRDAAARAARPWPALRTCRAGSAPGPGGPGPCAG